MRYALLVATICCILVPVNGQKATAKPNTNQQAPAKAQAPANKPINIDTVNVDKLNIAEQPNAPNKADGNANKPPSYLRRLIAPENLPNLVLCIIGIAGVIAAICTLRTIGRQTAATERAAEATRKSVELQEVALRQWVTIDNWKSLVFLPEDGGLSLHVQFDVTNPTDLPLTLDYAFIMLGDQGGKAGRSNLIPPKKSHPVITTVKITEEDRLKREQTELVFIVNGYIKFVDALEKDRSQEFGGVIGCSKTGVRFIPPYGPGIYIPDENQKQNPN